MAKTFAERFFPKQIEAARRETARALTDDFKRQAADFVRTVKASAPGVYSPGWNRSGGGKFSGGMSTSQPGSVFNHWQLRQQARVVYEESTQARAMVDRFVDTVVDSGLTVEPEPDADVLGITPEAAQEWGRKVRAAFHLWATQKRQHRAGLFTFYQAQHLVQTYAERDNDFFVRFYYDLGNRQLLNPLQFEIIDTNQIRGDTITSTILVGRYPDGIERNADGTEKAYNVWVQNANSTFDQVTIDKYTAGGKLQMLHGFRASYAGQGRGMSELGIALQEFEQITDFTQAYIQKAINQASIVLFNKPSKDAPASNVLEQIGTMGAGPASVALGGPGGVAGVAGNSVTSTTLNAVPIEEATFKQPGMAFFNLDSGEELVPFQSTAPTADFGAFVDSFTAYLCAAKGMPLEVLLMRFNQNYSASRAALLLFWRVACMKRDHLADDFLNPSYEAFLSCEIAAGRITCPGWSDPRIRAAWLACRWNGTPMPNIDPNSTAKADQLYVEMGAQTLDDVARNLNGSSGKANRHKLATEAAELSKAQFPWSLPGLGMATIGANAPQPNATHDTPNKPAKGANP